VAALVAASLLWAFSFGLIKGELAGLSPVAVAAGRLVVAAFVFLPLAGRGVADPRARLAAALLGAVQFGLMYVLYVASFRWLAAWVVALLTIFTPLYVMLLAGGLKGGGRLRNLAAVLLAIGGAGLVTVQGARAEVGWPGILLLQGANLCFAAGQLRFGALKRRTGAPDAGLAAWMYAGAAAVTVAALPVGMALGDDPFAGWSPRALLVLLYLGALPTAVGFYLWNRGAARTRPAFLAAANNLKVPLAVVVSWLVFGEAVAGGRALLGLVLLVGALLVAGNPAPRGDH
jgi:drug/metabolite transporter (DMT)-like permease